MSKRAAKSAAGTGASARRKEVPVAKKAKPPKPPGGASLFAQMLEVWPGDLVPEDATIAQLEKMDEQLREMARVVKEALTTQRVTDEQSFPELHNLLVLKSSNQSQDQDMSYNMCSRHVTAEFELAGALTVYKLLDKTEDQRM